MKVLHNIRTALPVSCAAVWLLLILIVSSCSVTHRKGTPLMTESLYMQYKRVNIEYPFDQANEVSEQVTFVEEDLAEQMGETLSDSSRLDTNLVYKLDEVKISTRSRFASERNGRVAIDFLIRVPKELLSQNWRMTLTPDLIDGDSVTALPDVIINGADFKAFQDKGYADYAAYEASIINPDAYNDVFLDREGISRDIRERQDLFLSLYREAWEHRTQYLRWRSFLEDRYRYFNLHKDANRANLYHKYMRDSEMDKLRRRISGIDTVGIEAGYTRRFEKRAKLFPHYHIERELTPRSVPRKYRLLHSTYGQWMQLTNNSMSEQDSVAISEHRYLYDDIAANELKKALLDETFRRLVPYPYRDEAGLKVDTLSLPDYNFFYLYRYEYPLTTGTKKLKVSLRSRVEAIDLSSHMLPTSDTLSYVISSMDQLVDTTLIVKKSKVYRDVKHNLTVYFKFPANRWEFDIAYEDNRVQMDTLVGAWNNFTRQGFIIDDVTMTAAASIDGNFQNNNKLSQRRVDALKAYLQTNHGARMNVAQIFHTKSIGEDWVMARRLIRKLQPPLPNADAILKKMARVSNPDKVEGEIRRGYKNDYQILRERVFPLLRRVDIAFAMHRPNMEVPDSIHSEYRQDYATALRLMENKQYNEAMNTLKGYADYNTALCLANLGQRENAYALLVQLEQTANVQYLSAIVLYQLGRKSEAATQLILACKADPDKVFRISRDTDMKALVREYGLQSQLDQVVNSF